ncbi:MAG: hypothetical protein RSE24_04145 [Oscillospiraceae bacterium]
MSKSVYSIVLMDDVVSAVDAVAAQNGTSRSNMINRILAQALGLQTPEDRISGIFSSIEDFFDEVNSFKTDFNAGGALINMRTSLQYKYNPCVKYSVEILTSGKYLGELRVSMRTQNARLVQYLDEFYKLWVKLEQTYVGTSADEYEYTSGRLFRKLRFPPGLTFQQSGAAIAQYTYLMDDCLKAFFSCLPSYDLAISLAENVYRDSLSAEVAKL